MKIELVKDSEKFEKVKLVRPNIIYNRFDIKYGKDFSLLQITSKRYVYMYVAFHIDESKNVCYLGVYMTDLKFKELKKLTDFLQKKYPQILVFYILQYPLPDKKQMKDMIYQKIVHWTLELPSTVEEYWKQFSSKTRYNRRKEKQKLEEAFDCEYIYVPRTEMTRDLMVRFLEMKNTTRSDVHYTGDPQELLSDFYYITDAYVLKANQKIVAMIFFSKTSDDVVYCENLCYDKEYSKYFVGNIIFYYSIEKLIERKIKKIYLGGGNYEYKANSKAVKNDTCSGYIRERSEIDKIVQSVFSIKNSGNKAHKIITLMGIKIKLRRKPKAA